METLMVIGWCIPLGVLVLGGVMGLTKEEGDGAPGGAGAQAKTAND